MSFYEWLSAQFSDLASAKAWYAKWRKSQETPFGPFSHRAMAAHISNVLEGIDEVEMDALNTLMNYTETKYGPEIYFCGWE